LKNINLVCADAYEYIKTIPNKSIDCIITDPPYDVSISGGGSVNNALKLNKSLNQLTKSKIDCGYDFEINKQFVRVMKDINIYIWCNKKQIISYFNYYVNQLDCKYEILCWHKTNALPTYSNKYVSDTEYCLFFHRGSVSVHPEKYEDALTYFFSPLNVRDKKEFKHPTIKPVEIIDKFIKNSTEEGDVILDPFMGSGTTGVSAKRLNRRFIGIDNNPEWYNVAVDRIDIENKQYAPQQQIFGKRKVSLI